MQKGYNTPFAKRSIIHYKYTILFGSFIIHLFEQKSRYLVEFLFEFYNISHKRYRRRLFLIDQTGSESLELFVRNYSCNNIYHLPCFFVLGWMSCELSSVDELRKTENRKTGVSFPDLPNSAYPVLS